MGKLSYGTTGVGYTCDAVKVTVSGAPHCPRCSNRVYFNEEKKALGKSWHTRCFTCGKCRKSLDSTNCNEHDGNIYCSTCHKREFGPTGYGFAMGAAGLSTGMSSPNLSTRHTSEQSAKSSSHISALFDALPNQQTGYKARVVTIATEQDGGDVCPRCQKRVYFAEKVDALKHRWHKLCFKCGACQKLLEPGKCNGHDGELYCQPCYSRKFGPQGYGFSGTLTYTDVTSQVHAKDDVQSAYKHSVIAPGTKEWTESVLV